MRPFVLGAESREMNLIETLLLQCGRPWCYALKQRATHDRIVFDRVRPSETAETYGCLNDPHFWPGHNSSEALAVGVSGPWGAPTFECTADRPESLLLQIIMWLARNGTLPAGWQSFHDPTRWCDPVAGETKQQHGCWFVAGVKFPRQPTSWLKIPSCYCGG